MRFIKRYGICCGTGIQLCHELVENRDGGIDFKSPDVAGILIAVPHAAEDIRRISDEPAVGIRVRRARFARDRNGFFERQRGGRAGIDDVFKQPCHDVGRFGADGAHAIFFVGKKKLAVLVVYFRIGDGGMVDPLVCKRAVCVCHLPHGYAARHGAERERRQRHIR